MPFGVCIAPWLFTEMVHKTLGHIPTLNDRCDLVADSTTTLVQQDTISNTSGTATVHTNLHEGICLRDGRKCTCDPYVLLLFLFKRLFCLPWPREGFFITDNFFFYFFLQKKHFFYFFLGEICFSSNEESQKRNSLHF